MNAKKALLICLTSLSTIFGAAAAPATAQTDSSTATTELTVTPTTEKRLSFKRGVEGELRNTAVKVLWKLSTHGEWDLTKKIWALQDIIYNKLPIPVYNRLVTALNDDTDRAKIIKALTDLANGVIGKDAAAATKCRVAINEWSKDPLGFARFVGKAIGKDLVQDTKPAAPAPK